MNLKFSTLEQVSISDIVETLNLAFAKYFVPINFTPENLALKMKQEGTILNLSVGAFDSDKLIGVILQGYRQDNGKQIVYNGGTGVLPAYRGQQITEQMYQFIIPKLIQNKIDEAWLEVITENYGAIKVYERTGFHKMQKVICWKQESEISLIEQPIAVSFRTLNTIDWSFFNNWNLFKPTWQNSNFAILNILENFNIIGVFINNNLIGYGIVNPLNGRISQFGIHPKWRRRKIGTLLFQHLAKITSTNLSIINVPSNAYAVIAFLEKIGFNTTLSQYEMCLKTTHKTL